MGKDKENTNSGDKTPMSAEEMEKLIEREAQHLQEEIKNLHFKDILEKNEGEYAKAKRISVRKLSKDGLAALAEEQAKIDKQIAREQRFDRIRRFLQIGIKFKSNEPDSELFKTAKELQDIVDKCESNSSSVSVYERKKFETGMSRYRELLKAEYKSGKKPAEIERDITPAKRWWIRGWLWIRAWFKGLGKELYGLTIERITKAYLDKYG